MGLKQKKILLILNDIDKHEQLEKLAGDCNWFSSGSWILITTRDKHLLVRHGVQSIYNIEAFIAKESLELLSWNVFKSNDVNPSYMKVLNHVASYAEGLPLALGVVGSYLCEKIGLRFLFEAICSNMFLMVPTTVNPRPTRDLIHHVYGIPLCDLGPIRDGDGPMQTIYKQIRRFDLRNQIGTSAWA